MVADVTMMMGVTMVRRIEGVRYRYRKGVPRSEMMMSKSQGRD